MNHKAAIFYILAYHFEQKMRKASKRKLRLQYQKRSGYFMYKFMRTIHESWYIPEEYTVLINQLWNHDYILLKLREHYRLSKS